jgi:hypothetical protein
MNQLNWINVEDQLPEMYKRLLLFDAACVDMGFVTNEFGTLTTSGFFCIGGPHEPTHWMYAKDIPIPYGISPVIEITQSDTAITLKEKNE